MPPPPVGPWGWGGVGALAPLSGLWSPRPPFVRSLGPPFVAQFLRRGRYSASSCSSPVSSGLGREVFWEDSPREWRLEYATPQLLRMKIRRLALDTLEAQLQFRIHEAKRPLVALSAGTRGLQCPLGKASLGILERDADRPCIFLSNFGSRSNASTDFVQVAPALGFLSTLLAARQGQVPLPSSLSDSLGRLGHSPF